jgi:hypothetical protein
VGQSVRVYPHGDPGQAATGTVTLISSNQRAIAVAFDHLPPFAFAQAPVIGIHPEYGVILCLSPRDRPVDRAGRWRALRD